MQDVDQKLCEKSSAASCVLSVKRVVCASCNGLKNYDKIIWNKQHIAAFKVNSAVDKIENAN